MSQVSQESGRPYVHCLARVSNCAHTGEQSLFALSKYGYLLSFILTNFSTRQSLWHDHRGLKRGCVSAVGTVAKQYTG